MLYLFLKPVIYASDIMPIPGIPSLIGVLENNGINCQYINLNADYLDYLDNNKILQEYNKFLSFCEKKEYYNFHPYFKDTLLRQKDNFLTSLSWLSKNARNFEIYRNLAKNKKIMYSFSIYWYYQNLLFHIKNIHIPLLASFAYYNENDFCITPDDILFIFNCNYNCLKDFYLQKASIILSKKPDIIGVQIINYNDLISGLLLCYAIKQINKNVHLTIGGNFFEENFKRIKNLKELFGIFFDSIAVGESTNTVLELVKFVNKDIPISDVSNLIYLNNDKLQFNECGKLVNINQLPFQSFSGYKENDYFLPELVLPVRASMSTSCYWGKCIYCSCSGEEKHFRIMSAKRLVDEIEFLSKKYNTKYFAFWDNALHPQYISKVADLLLERNINIKYNIYARLEKEFNPELLKKIKKSGCIAVHWGLDSTSQRICNDIINKNINIKTAEKILENSHKAGILNSVYLIFGFPTETKEEMKAAFDFIKKNAGNIDAISTIRNLFFPENSILFKYREYYKSLINYSADYENYKSNIMNLINKKMKTVFDSSIGCQWQYLYIAKYGKLRCNIIKNLKYYYTNSKNKLLKKVISKYYKFIIKKAENLNNNI